MLFHYSHGFVLLTSFVFRFALRRFCLQPFPRQFNRFVRLLLQQFAFWQFGHVFGAFSIKIALKAVIKIDNFSKMAPSQLCTKGVHNFLIGKNLSKSDNIKKIAGNGFVVCFPTRFAIISL